MEDKSYKDNIQKKFAQASGSALSREGDDAFFEDAWNNIAPKISESPKNSYLVVGWVTLLLFMLLAWNVQPGGPNMSEADMQLAKNMATSESIENQTSQAPIEEEEVAELLRVDVTQNSKNLLSSTPTAVDKNQSAIKVTSSQSNRIINQAGINKKKSSSQKAGDLYLATQEKSKKGKGDSKSSLNPNQFISEFEPLLNTSIISGIAINDEEIKMPKPLVTLDDISETEKWFLGVYGQFGSSQFIGHNSDQKVNGLSFELMGGRSFEQGISLHHQGGRNILTASIGFGKHEMISQYKLHVNYKSTGEFSDGMGFLHNAYEHDLQTIGGALGIKHVLFRNEEDQLSEGEAVPFELALTQTIQFIPFAMEYAYEWPLHNKLHLESGFGIEGRYNWMDKAFDDIELRSEHHLVHHNYTETQSVDARNLQPWSMGINARLSLQYEVNRFQWILGVRVQETILDPALHDNMEVHPTFVSGHLGMRYNLK